MKVILTAANAAAYKNSTGAIETYFVSKDVRFEGLDCSFDLRFQNFTKDVKEYDSKLAENTMADAMGVTKPWPELPPKAPALWTIRTQKALGIAISGRLYQRGDKWVGYLTAYHTKKGDKGTLADFDKPYGWSTNVAYERGSNEFIFEFTPREVSLEDAESLMDSML